MTSTVFARGSKWGEATLYDGWGDNVTEEQVTALASLVIERFENLGHDAGSSAFWQPETSEVISDVDDNVSTEQLETWREQALAEVWSAVIDESDDTEMCATVAEIFKENSPTDD